MEINESPALELWRLRCLRATRMHYDCVSHYDRRERLLTIGNVAASIVILVLSTIHLIYGLDNLLFNSLIAVSSPVIVVTSILQYVLDYKSRALAHSHAGAGYAQLNRKIESLAARSITREDTEKVRQRLDALGQNSPVPLPRILNQQAALNQEIRARELALGARFTAGGEI
ncbi:MAG: hypothetical protein KGL26_00235 [Pseudomonadota bacterium]|nr:hypothetical protein [Pseudomonadota bacterium]